MLVLFIDIIQGQSEKKYTERETWQKFQPETSDSKLRPLDINHKLDLQLYGCGKVGYA